MTKPYNLEPPTLSLPSQMRNLAICFNKNKPFQAPYHFFFVFLLTCSQKVSNVGGQLLNHHIVEPLDVKQHPLVVTGHKVDGNTLPTKTTTTTNAMQVVLWLGGKVIVDDQGHLLHVNTTSKEVGGDEHTRRARPELPHDDVPSVLVHVTVSGRHCVVPAPHLVSKPVHLAAGVDKDDTLSDSQGLVQVTECVQLPIFLLHIHIELLDTLEGKLIPLHKDSHRFVHELAGNLKGLRRHGSRENANLNLSWEELEDVIDLQVTKEMDITPQFNSVETSIKKINGQKFLFNMI
jgi:hypothetical protein